MIIGDTGVGKTSLMNRYLFNKFDEEQMPSMGAQSKPHLVTVPNEGQIKLTIWDTAGQEKFRSLTRMYFQDAEAAIIVYDTTFRDSFEGARRWIDELRANANIQDPVVALVGNKSDLASAMQVSFEEAHNLQSETKLDFVKETSAKAEDNNGVQELFVDIARRLIKKHKAKTVSRLICDSKLNIGR